MSQTQITKTGNAEQSGSTSPVTMLICFVNAPPLPCLGSNTLSSVMNLVLTPRRVWSASILGPDWCQIHPLNFGSDVILRQPNGDLLIMRHVVSQKANLKRLISWHDDASRELRTVLCQNLRGATSSTEAR